MDRLSERVRKMVEEWRNEVAKRNRLGIGPSGGMAFAYERCADTLEKLLPQIESLEQREDALIQEALQVVQYVPQHIAPNYDTLIKFVRARLVRKEQSK